MSKRISFLTESQREKIDDFIQRCIKEEIFNNEVEALRVITPFYCDERLTEQHFELPKEQLLEIFQTKLQEERVKLAEEDKFNFDKRNEVRQEQTDIPADGRLF